MSSKRKYFFCAFSFDRRNTHYVDGIVGTSIEPGGDEFFPNIRSQIRESFKPSLPPEREITVLSLTRLN